jgi:hypothetical protein
LWIWIQGFEIFADPDPYPGFEIFENPDLDPDLDVSKNLSIFYVKKIYNKMFDPDQIAESDPDPGNQKYSDPDPGTPKMRIQC